MTKPKQKNLSPKLTDSERHKRFVDMAEEVCASKKAEDFDAAFKTVTAKKPSSN